MVMLAILVAVPVVMAQEHAEEGHQPSIFEGGLHNAIWTLLIFLTVVLVLGKFAWKPLLGALKAREDFIRESLESAKKEREESAELLKKYTDQINKAREEATAITQEGRRDAEEVKRKISAEARAEADAMIKRAKREIAIAHQDAITEIYNTLANISTQIAERVLHREVDPEEHRAIIARALESVKEEGKASSN
jgi:F-type H+-transporting ATPase subunit b